MKFIKNSVRLMLVTLMALASCTDFVEPRVPYAEFDTGTYLRTISRISDSFDFFDLESSRFALTLEAVDIEDGGTVSTVEIRVRHRRLIPGVGLEFTPAAGDNLVTTLDASDFTPNTESRFLRTTFSIDAVDAIAAAGLTLADIEAGDTFEFRLVLTTTSGRVFSADNRSADVAGGFFYASPFLYNVSVICPSDLAGEYAYVNEGATGPLGSCDGPQEGTVTLTARADGFSYSVSDGTFGYWACIGDTWGDGDVRLSDACGVLSLSGTDKYGDSYSMEVIATSTEEITFVWVNTYGETGTVTLFANPGVPFPDNLR
ncbi:hypothetical protein A3SI_18944 [Nitritalea halalkaliphila LW7]|uniref:DUF1735 domain-containing protein n=1 Tax=Nitritalea halalkaliphila LW7 TaxID=1189621 RepID=I5BTU9_9BACT|nr:hypothetical protein [Nitritalea halalkaliphila]EIM73001.1 hypothetical protein A3SI_18944 [Nitritalea halalkaliphila LW7]